ncbi:MAG: SDR family oxidoreductase [Candidatus Yonathbacteria bacterium]|nr:SDR family oxidoreductase [Candidatus Yonathbacteria bacterium]
MKRQIVLITGSSSGIGRETAYRFAREGARVVLTYYRGKTRGEAAERRCRKLGAADTLLLHLDVTNNESVAEAVVLVKRKYGPVDFLINNAGTGKFIPFQKQTVKDIERQIRTNLEGLIKVTRAFLPQVKKGIINVASAAGKEPYEEMSVYCGSKFGVRGFTQTLALEHPRLQVCCVNPDQVATRLSGYQGRPPEDVAEVIFRVASGRISCKHGRDVDVWEVI